MEQQRKVKQRTEGLNSAAVGKKYDSYAAYYDILHKPMEILFYRKWRRNMLKNLEGSILEVGVGTGKNLPYYSSKAKVTAIDISPKMLSIAVKKSKDLGIAPLLIRMDAQRLRFPAEKFDYVVCVFVLCSVPDPAKALREMQRVVKKNGRVIMLEHVLSRHKLIAFWQHLLNPFTRLLLGFNINRDTRKNIENAGLYIIKDEKLALFDVFRKFTCKKR